MGDGVIIPVITHLSSYSVEKKVKGKINMVTRTPPASPHHHNALPLTAKLSCLVFTEGVLRWGSELGDCI